MFFIEYATHEIEIAHIDLNVSREVIYEKTQKISTSHTSGNAGGMKV
jgi:hypothetical protein